MGIESDAAVSTARPLKDTLKITESMTNLLSDEDNLHDGELRDLDRESPLHIEGIYNSAYKLLFKIIKMINYYLYCF